MRWDRGLALLLFLVVFGVALVLQAPQALLERVVGARTPLAMALVVSDPDVIDRGLSWLGAAERRAQLAWRYDRFSFSRLGPVYRVRVAGQGFAGRGHLVVTPFDRRLLLSDVRLTLSLPSVDEALRETLIRPLGRVEIAMDRFEADLEPSRIDGPLGRVRWENARIESDAEIDIGTVEAQLSAPELNVIHAEIVNQDGDMALSGTVSLTVNEAVSVDLYLQPRPGITDTAPSVLRRFATPEPPGWRLRHTIATGDWLAGAFALRPLPDLVEAPFHR